MNKIGTLSEKSIHSQLKLRYEPNQEYHEKSVGRYIADILKDKTIIEVQTAQLYKLASKLEFYIENGYDVTVVYPVEYIKKINWVTEDGEILDGSKRKNNKARYNILSEMNGITQFIGNENFRIRVVELDCEEYRKQDGYGKDKKTRATKLNKMINSIVNEYTISSKQDVMELANIQIEKFTVKELGKVIPLKQRKLYGAVHTLEKLEIIYKYEKMKNTQIWRLNTDEKKCII